MALSWCVSGIGAAEAHLKCWAENVIKFNQTAYKIFS
jgi:hypothetical protein